MGIAVGTGDLSVQLLAIAARDADSGGVPSGMESVLGACRVDSRVCSIFSCKCKACNCDRSCSASVLSASRTGDVIVSCGEGVVIVEGVRRGVAAA